MYDRSDPSGADGVELSEEQWSLAKGSDTVVGDNLCSPVREEDGFSGQSLQCTRNLVFDVLVLQTVEQVVGRGFFNSIMFSQLEGDLPLSEGRVSFVSIGSGTEMPKPCLGLSFPKIFKS